jgi:hypothetical protein
MVGGTAPIATRSPPIPTRSLHRSPAENRLPGWHRRVRGGCSRGASCSILEAPGLCGSPSTPTFTHSWTRGAARSIAVRTRVVGSVSCSCRTNATQQQQQQPERRGWLFSWRTPFTAPPLAPGCPPVFSHCGRRAPRPVHCRKRLAGKLRRDTLWRPGFAALTNREGCPLHNAAGWPRVEVNLMPAAGSWILKSFCSLGPAGNSGPSRGKHKSRKIALWQQAGAAAHSNTAVLQSDRWAAGYDARPPSRGTAVPATAAAAAAATTAVAVAVPAAGQVGTASSRGCTGGRAGRVY